MTENKPNVVASSTPGESGLPLPRRYWAVMTTAVGIGMAVLDSTIVNVALPAIARDLGVTAADAVWVVNAFLIAVASSLLPLSSLGEVVGYRRIYLGGLLLFTAASVFCALADSLTSLMIARFVQGFGAAGIMSVNIALVRFTHPSDQLGRGIGINAMVVAVATALGPTVAAVILLLGSWHWLFAINVPLGGLALLMGYRALPFSQQAGHRLDLPSVLLNAGGLVVLILAIDGFGRGYAPSLVAAGLIAAVLLFGLLVRRQLVLPVPLLPVDLLRIPAFALAIGAAFCTFVAHMLTFISIPFFLQDVLGRTAVETGLLMTPWPLAVVVMAPVAGYLADRYPTGVMGMTGMLVMAFGLLLLALLPEGPSDGDILWRMAVCGVGFGLFHSPNNRTVIGSAPRARTGGAAGMQGTARLLGQTLGAALAALIFSFGTDMTSTALLVGAGFAAASGVLCGLRLAPGYR